MVKIVQDGDKVLRMKAKEVLVKDILSPKIQKVISNMKEALLTQDDGVAIAAPQIGENLRIFVVSGKIFDEKFMRGKGTPKNYKTKEKDLVFINPKITKISKKNRLASRRLFVCETTLW
jgi:peptide deformylase